MADGFISISAFLNVISGLALLVYWYAFAILLPYRDLSTTLVILVKNRNWQWINGLGVLGALAGLLGQAGIYIFQLPSAGSFAVAGYYVATLGTALLLGTMLWDTILWPILVNHDETLLSFQGPVYLSRTFLPFFVTSGLVYSAGFVLVGIGILQANTLPAAAGYLVAVGAPLFGLGAMFGKYQVYPRSTGVTLMGIGLLWIGLAMLS